MPLTADAQHSPAFLEQGVLIFSSAVQLKHKLVPCSDSRACREYAFPHGERDAAFQGNHRLEALLFRYLVGSAGSTALN